MGAAGRVFLLSGQTAHGRTERVLRALDAAGHPARLLYPRRDGELAWPALTTDDILVIHYGSVRHTVSYDAQRFARRAHSRFLMIRSLTIPTILEFVATCRSHPQA